VGLGCVLVRARAGELLFQFYSLPLLYFLFFK
jgi:hypothetical protein